jgi:WD40 repeat protein
MIRVSLDNQTLVTANTNAVVNSYALLEWNIATGEATPHFQNIMVDILSVDFCPERSTNILLYGSEFNFGAFDFQRNQEYLFPSNLNISDVRVLSAACNHGSNMGAFGTNRGEIYIWEDFQNQGSIRLLAQNTQTDFQVITLDFSYNDLLLASNYADALAVILDVATGQEISQYRPLSYTNVTAIEFAPDGHLLIGGSEAGEVYAWLVPPLGAELVEWVENNRYLREITCEERITYLVDPFCD